MALIRTRELMDMEIVRDTSLKSSLHYIENFEDKKNALYVTGYSFTRSTFCTIVRFVMSAI
jgi:hypothetical protein